MRTFLHFIAVGTLFSTVEEFLTVAVLKHDMASYLFTLLVVFPVFLTGVWFVSRLMSLFIVSEPAQELVHFFLFGCVGLLLEWFLMGLAPWSDPNANPLVMFVFQLGMFSFWATVAFAPRLFTSPLCLSRDTSVAIAQFYVPYFAFVFAICFLSAPEARFVRTVALIVLGYLPLNYFYAIYFIRRYANSLLLIPRG